MASNQTPVYGLNQWSLDDQVIMNEFNSDNAKIEQALLELKASLPKFQIGTYVGTGTNGSATPTSLTFDFEPILLLIVPEPVVGEYQTSVSLSESIGPLVAIRGASSATVSYDCDRYGGNFDPVPVNLNWNGNTVSWYNDHLLVAQYNCTNTTYRYLAIG